MGRAWISGVLCVMVAGCGIATVVDRDTNPGHDAGHVLGLDGGRPEPRDAFVPWTMDVGRDAPALEHDASNSVCNPVCSSDFDCASTCGAVPGGGLRCCDVATGHCYISHVAACPSAPMRDAGRDAPGTPLDACVSPPAGTTVLTVHAPGLANATITLVLYYAGVSPTFTLDGTGTAVVNIPAITVYEWNGHPMLTDGYGDVIPFHVTRGAASADVYPTCVGPDPADLYPLDSAEVWIQRDRATGLCAGSVLSVVVACTAYHGDYTASSFDDLPCGPFR